MCKKILENTKRVIKSRKDIQTNDWKTNNKRTNNEWQNNTQKTIDRTTQAH
jgi:hypothetical protein